MDKVQMDLFEHYKLLVVHGELIVVLDMFDLHT